MLPSVMFAFPYIFRCHFLANKSGIMNSLPCLYLSSNVRDSYHYFLAWVQNNTSGMSNNDELYLCNCSVRDKVLASQAGGDAKSISMPIRIMKWHKAMDALEPTAQNLEVFIHHLLCHKPRQVFAMEINTTQRRLKNNSWIIIIEIVQWHAFELWEREKGSFITHVILEMKRWMLNSEINLQCLALYLGNIGQYVCTHKMGSIY